MPKRLKLVLFMIAAFALPNVWHVFRPVSPVSHGTPMFITRIVLDVIILTALYSGARAGWKFTRIWYCLGIVLSIMSLVTFAIHHTAPTLANVAWSISDLGRSSVVFVLLGHASVRAHFGTLKQTRSTTTASTATNDPAADGTI